VDACAYDGVGVSLVASLQQPAAWPRAVAVGESGLVFVARPAESPDPGGLLEAWRLGDTGAFEKQSQTGLTRPAQQLKPWGNLLATQSAGAVEVFQVAAAALNPVGSTLVPGCYWPDLTRAVAEPGRALWLPLGEYGLLTVPLKAGP
jgi:hypothetical protein